MADIIVRNYRQKLVPGEYSFIYSLDDVLSANDGLGFRSQRRFTLWEQFFGCKRLQFLQHSDDYVERGLGISGLLRSVDISLSDNQYGEEGLKKVLSKVVSSGLNRRSDGYFLQSFAIRGVDLEFRIGQQGGVFTEAWTSLIKVGVRIRKDAMIDFAFKLPVNRFCSKQKPMYIYVHGGWECRYENEMTPFYQVEVLNRKLATLERRSIHCDGILAKGGYKTFADIMTVERV